MYRRNAAPVAEEQKPPGELAYSATDRSRRGNSAVAMFQFFSLPALSAVALTVVAGPTAGLLGLVGAGGAAVWWWRRAPHAGGVVLRVEDHELRVLSSDRKTERARFSLDDLDVVVDTKTIQKMQESGDAVPDMRFINATAGPELDTARIVITSTEERLTLTDEFVSHMDAMEWFGKIRVFLRKQGWVPADERAPDSSAPDSSSPDSSAPDSD